jgi:4-hydroxy-tetrahydrodipicolinate reductase
MKLAIAGASGKMGRMLIEAALAESDFVIGAALDRANSPDVGRDCGEFLGRTTGARVAVNLDSVAGCDVLIDFTRPEATLAHLAACAAAGVNIVIGTTGFDEAGKAAIARAADKIAIVFGPNMSIGVNATFKLAELAARLLQPGYDVEIIEAHHRQKVDAPSGTALKLGEMVASAQDRALSDIAVFAREGITGARKAGTIGFAAVRGGDIVGEHTVLFAGTGERIEITHRSTSRANYASGALRAARFLHGKSRGLFDMFDVLGLR